jgi:hypothetical protein
MPKPAVVAIGAAGAIALAVILGAFALTDRRPKPTQLDEPAPFAEPASSESTAAPVEPLPPLLTALAASATLQKPAEKTTTKQIDETSMLDKLHELAASDPLLSLQLAREAVSRFPDSPNAPEFEWNVVKSLANMERFDEARDEARIMIEKYPGNSFAEDVDRHLLNHPPNPTNTP